jgi:hypothetical protein
LKEFRAQWVRLPNGFYDCKVLDEKRKSFFLSNNDLLLNDWEKHVDCLSLLSPTDVKKIFGKPSIIQHAFSEKGNTKIVNYFFIISDKKCNPNMIMPYNLGSYENNILYFAFFNDKQIEKYKPRLSLPCE